MFGRISAPDSSIAGRERPGRPVAYSDTERGAGMLRTALACLIVAGLLVDASGTAQTGPAMRQPRWGGQAPQLQVPGAFRSAITLVPIDVRVLDRDGRPVTGLKQDDFTILEDGVRQEIAHFDAHVLTPQPGRGKLGPDGRPVPAAGEQADPFDSAQGRLPLRKAPSYDIAPQQHRIFLIMLGRGRLREPSHALEALAHFVRERLLPQDRVAVFAWNRATDFTTDHEKVAQVIERFDRAHEAIEGKLRFHFSSLAVAYGSKEIPAAIQTDIDGVFGGSGESRPKGRNLRTQEGGSKITPGVELPNRQLLPGAVADSGRMETDAARVMGDLLSGAAVAATDLPFEEFVEENARTMQDLGNLYAGIEYLRFLEGEKHLMLVTEKGLFLPREEDDKRIAEAASTARVVIDTIETGGLYVGQSDTATRGGANPGQWSQWWAFTSLRTIAELTGGRSAVAEWTRPAVDRIDESTRAGYLLGYYPRNMKWDGRYRKVTVKVDRPGLTVLYRHGYEASDQLVPFDRQAFLTFNRIIAAALYPDDVRDIKLKVGAHPIRLPALSGVEGKPDPTGSTIRLKPDPTAEVAGGAGAGNTGGTEREIAVDVTIDASRISFAVDSEADPPVHVAHLDVAVFASDTRGRVTDERWQKIDLALKDEEYERCRRDGIPYLVRLPGKPATREVKVIVYDYAGDVLGSAVARVF